MGTSRRHHEGARPMKDDEYRALVEAGPAVVMVAKEDMLKLLNRIILLTEANRLADEIIKNHEDERLESLVAFNLCDND
jgi:CDP-diacylglycerol pyrophosphatase